MPVTQTQSPYKGSGQITREQFLFYEMRITSRLMAEGLKENEIIEQIVKDNLFQYPTEKSIRQMAKTCIKRLKCLEDEGLVAAIASQPIEVSKQICLYAMMRQYRLIWDFMITVIGEKFRIQDFSFGKKDVSVFFMQLQEQDAYVAGWSEATLNKVRQVIMKLLVENEYLDCTRSERLNPVWLYPVLEQAIKEKNEERALTAFNYFS